MSYGFHRSIQDKLDHKDKDYCMVMTETFLNYLYQLEAEDKQERGNKQRLNESLEKRATWRLLKPPSLGEFPRRTRRNARVTVWLIKSAISRKVERNPSLDSNAHCVLPITWKKSLYKAIILKIVASRSSMQKPSLPARRLQEWVIEQTWQIH